MITKIRKLSSKTDNLSHRDRTRVSPAPEQKVCRTFVYDLLKLKNILFTRKSTLCVKWIKMTGSNFLIGIQ